MTEEIKDQVTDIHRDEITQALESLASLSQQGRFRDFWQQALELEGFFMTQREALGDQFQRLWARYERLCSGVRQEEASRQRQRQANASRIERELQRLATQHRVPPTQDSPGGYRFGPFLAHSRDLQAMLENLDLADDDRDRLKAEFDRIRAPVMELYSHEQEESQRNRRAIEDIVNEALARAQGAMDREVIISARSRLREALQPLKEAKMLREDRDAAWAFWREAHGKLALQEQTLLDEAFAGVQQRAQQCVEEASRGDPYEALQSIKTLQQELARQSLRREQREQVRQVLGDAWERAQSRIGELRVERQRRREERQRRREEWKQRMAANLEKWAASLAEAQAELEQLHKDIKGLEEEEQNAGSPAYAQVLRRLIKEKHQEIAKLEQQIKDWQAKIQDVRGSLQQEQAASPQPVSSGEPNAPSG